MDEIITTDNIMTRFKIQNALSKGKVTLVAKKEDVPTEKFALKNEYLQIDFIMWEYPNTVKGMEEAVNFGKKHLREFQIYKDGEFQMSVR